MQNKRESLEQAWNISSDDNVSKSLLFEIFCSLYLITISIICQHYLALFRRQSASKIAI